MKRLHRNDLLLFLLLLLVTAASYAGITLYQRQSTDHAMAVITLNKENAGHYPLDEDLTFTLEAEEGGYNVIQIKDGRASIIEASCPDQICVNHRSVSRNSQTIVCLPNRLILRIENAPAAEVDAVTN